jgi:glycosyltransferase involved in cell wall biosynthesis
VGSAPDRGEDLQPNRGDPGALGIRTSRNPRRIGIDARPLRWPGIGRYVRELVSQLAEIDSTDDFFVYCDSEQTAAHFRSRWPNVRVSMVASALYTVGEQVRLPLRILRDRLDVFHSPASLTVPLLCPCRLVVTVHDLLLKNHPEHLPSRLAGIYFWIMNGLALRFAKQLLTVSDFTRMELVAAYPRYASKVRTAHNGVGPAFKPTRDAQRLQGLKRMLGLRKSYLLYVGTYKKHKNLPFLIEAFSRLNPRLRADVQLLVLGPRDPRYPEVDSLVSRLGLQRDVVQIARVEEQELIDLYSGAEAVVAPSIYEGFGFSVLEAMACGTAVIATRIPAFVEVAGDCATFVEPGDGAGMTSALTTLIEDADLRHRTAAAGLERSARFSWRSTAIKTLESYRAAMTDEIAG